MVSQPSRPDARGWRRGDARGWPAAERGLWPAEGGDDGWGPSTAVYSGSANQRGRTAASPAPPQPDTGWAQAGPLPRRGQRGTRSADRRTAEPVRAPQASTRAPERGWPWWAALLLLIVVAAIGGIIDTLGSIDVKGGFNVGIVVASVLAILVVKRSHMFPIVIAPPIVYSAAAVLQLYVNSSGLHDKKVVLDSAANYLVYGFPAIASATAAVLIVAGFRLIARK